MSGRGRGRGGGSRAILQKALRDSGSEPSSKQIMEEITNPPLFPDYHWHSNGSIVKDPSTHRQSSRSKSRLWSGHTPSLINLSREIPQQLQASPFFVLPRIEPDVVRYGKRSRPLDADALLIRHAGNSATSAYIPQELLDLKDDDPSSWSRRSSRRSNNTNNSGGGGGDARHDRSRLDDQYDDATDDDSPSKKKAKNNDPSLAEALVEDQDYLGESDNDQQEEDQDEGDVDYTHDYYASDDDDGGDLGEDRVYE